MSIDTFISSVNWNQLFTTIGSSAIISGLVSALVNYILTMKRLKKEREIKFIEDKMGLYSVIIFHLEYLVQWFVNPPSSPNFNASKIIEEIIKMIDNELKNRFYLLDLDSAAKWMWFKRYTYELDECKIQEYRKNIYWLRNNLAEKYNNDLKPQYEALVGKKLNKIPSLDDPTFSKNSTISS